jgi:hypothetical protein
MTAAQDELLTRQIPVPLQVSGSVQAVSIGLPHAVPAARNPSAGHAPAPLQFSATSQSPEAARQVVVMGAWFTWHDPVALQVSGSVQAVSLGLPHAVPAAWNPSAGHAPAALQVSAASHSPAAARQVVVMGA